MEVVEGRGQIGGGEVRPHARHEPELGIGAFPEEEIAQALLASGADQDVDVRSLGSGMGRQGAARKKPSGQPGSKVFILFSRFGFKDDTAAEWK